MGFLRSSLLFSALAGWAFTQSTDQNATPTSESMEACARVSSIVSSVMIASPSATRVQLPPDLAHNCTLSVPIFKQDALALVDGLTAWLQSQSTLAYLKNPPSGYLMQSVDILGGLQEIRAKVEADGYAGELPFQFDLALLTASAHDGHFGFQPDMMGVFGYERTVGNLLSISMDGQAVPEIYCYSDLAQAQNTSLGWEPSPIVMIDGQDVLDWLDYQALNTTVLFQDPDAAWNSLFYEIPSPQGNVPYVLDEYAGVSDNFTFANGTSTIFPIIALTRQDFDGVVDGPSFYQKFCNATLKMEADASSPAAASSTTSSPPTKTSTPAELALVGYPEPEFVDEDGTLAGFFLRRSGLEDTAVLAVKGFEPTSDKSFIETMRKFLEACRKEKKTHLVIDVSGNGGGNILLAVDMFKQLFPTVDPYYTFSLRATSQLEVLMDYYTTSTASLSHDDLDAFSAAGGDSDYDVSALDNAAGQPYVDFESFWNPFEANNDTFTPLARNNYSNVEASEIEDGLVVSGYGDNDRLGPQAFSSENIILLTDGQCSSSCHTFSHLLKWQGKVKSVAVGGRPQTDGQPMQYVGGVKGSEVIKLGDILPYVGQLYEEAPDEVIEQANQTGLLTLLELGNYTIYRSVSPETSEYVSINYQNFISQYDSTYTPMQFVYEAADCRVWYSLEMAFDIEAVWARAAKEGFAIGPNATEIFAGCIQGSTGAPSSLSGNATLFNNGEIANVTEFIPSTTAAEETSTGAVEAEETATENSSGRSSGPAGLGGVMVLASCLYLALFLL